MQASGASSSDVDSYPCPSSSDANKGVYLLETCLLSFYLRISG